MANRMQRIESASVGTPAGKTSDNQTPIMRFNVSADLPETMETNDNDINKNDEKIDIPINSDSHLKTNAGDMNNAKSVSDTDVVLEDILLEVNEQKSFQTNEINTSMNVNDNKNNFLDRKDDIEMSPVGVPKNAVELQILNSMELNQPNNNNSNNNTNNDPVNIPSKVKGKDESKTMNVSLKVDSGPRRRKLSKQVSKSNMDDFDKTHNFTHSQQLFLEDFRSELGIDVDDTCCERTGKCCIAYCCHSNACRWGRVVNIWTTFEAGGSILFKDAITLRFLQIRYSLWFAVIFLYIPNVVSIRKWKDWIFQLEMFEIHTIYILYITASCFLTNRVWKYTPSRAERKKSGALRPSKKDVVTMALTKFDYGRFVILYIIYYIYINVSK